MKSLHLNSLCRLLQLCAAACLFSPAMAEERVLETQTNRMVEVEVKASRAYADPFNEVTLDVLFTDPAGTEHKVPAFWAGGNAWKVRYSSGVPGTHRFKSAYPDAGDAGLRELTGRVEISAYDGKNPLYIRGAPRVADDKRHFAFGDGTPFFWLGDTWWMGLTKRLAWPDDFHALAADRVAKGFTVVQIVAGLYPDMPAFDERGENEAGFPWERDYSRIRPEYFDAADRRIIYIAEQGMVPCVVGAWGYHLPWLGKEKMKQHWRNIIARWGALPVVWCAAGETTMPFYLSKTPKEDTPRQQREWTEVIRSMRETDPFHRMITTHPAQTARASVTDPSVLDFDMHQSGHGSPAAQHAALALSGWKTKPVMPVISGEARYEALEIRPTLTDADARMAFWSHLINSGCAGHTYGVNGVWQVNGKTKPYGNSPAGNNWGTTPWDVAMKLPGSAQLGAAKKLITSFPHWRNLEPHPEWISSTDAMETPLTFAGAQWIWYPEGEPSKDAPVAKRYFQTSFSLPKDKFPATARLAISADDYCQVWLNGQRLGERADWMRPLEVGGLQRKLRTAGNVISIVAENRDPSAHPNPAGLIARLEVILDDGSRMDIFSDAKWRSAVQPHDSWRALTSDDPAWVAAKPLGAWGVAPWGKVQSTKSASGPLCAGSAELLRLVYFPAPGSAKLKALPTTGVFDEAWFNPVTGQRSLSLTIRPDDAGNVSLTTPEGEHDWLYILRRIP
jgi:hypothetical protein